MLVGGTTVAGGMEGEPLSPECLWWYHWSLEGEEGEPLFTGMLVGGTTVAGR